MYRARLGHLMSRFYSALSLCLSLISFELNLEV